MKRRAAAATTEDQWYDEARLYDVAFQADTKREAAFLERAFDEFALRSVRRVLEPGCGTGRLVAELAARGRRVAGFDQNVRALDYLRRRLRRRKLSADVFVADLAQFECKSRFDAAFCLCNTFRHLLTEEAARSHLQCVADALNPGGVYILGLHLLPADADYAAFERWKEKRGGVEVTVSLSVKQAFPRRRLEIIRIVTTARGPRGVQRRAFEFPLRIYRPAQFVRLLAGVPEFEHVETFDFWHDIEHPTPLESDSVDVVAVLRKRATRR